MKSKITVKDFSLKFTKIWLLQINQLVSSQMFKFEMVGILKYSINLLAAS